MVPFIVGPCFRQPWDETFVHVLFELCDAEVSTLLLEQDTFAGYPAQLERKVATPKAMHLNIQGSNGCRTVGSILVENILPG